MGKSLAYQSRRFPLGLNRRAAYVRVIRAAGGMSVLGGGAVIRTRGKREKSFCKRDHEVSHHVNREMLPEWGRGGRGPPI